MRITHDPLSDSLSLRFNAGEYAYSQTIGIDCLLDFDAEGHIIGIEFLNASRHVTDPQVLEYVNLAEERKPLP